MVSIHCFFTFFISKRPLPGPGSWLEDVLRAYVALANIDRSVQVDHSQDSLVLADRGIEQRQNRAIGPCIEVHTRASFVEL